MSEPTSMTTRTAVPHGPHDLRVQEIPVSPPGPDAVGVCGSDMRYTAEGRVVRPHGAAA
ncbi:hypothetical protein [Streptomyces spongiae]|uniref:hypothetical protein n=1 Tax=Streptomyces spongiae TaxID=565072 RepID=UPI0018844ABB|nr:hypothetical protein [Streptomyces spongiae]